MNPTLSLCFPNVLNPSCTSALQSPFSCTGAHKAASLLLKLPCLYWLDLSSSWQPHLGKSKVQKSLASLGYFFQNKTSPVRASKDQPGPTKFSKAQPVLSCPHYALNDQVLIIIQVYKSPKAKLKKGPKAAWSSHYPEQDQPTTERPKHYPGLPDSIQDRQVMVKTAQSPKNDQRLSKRSKSQDLSKPTRPMQSQTNPTSPTQAYPESNQAQQGLIKIRQS